MKKLTLVGLVLLAGATSGRLHAQDISIGVKGGLSSAIHRGLDGNGDTLNVTRRAGTHIGALLIVDFYKEFGLQIEGLYVEKGSQDPAGQGSLSLAYLQVPVLLKGNLPLGRSNVHVLAGPALAYEVRCRLSGLEGPVVVSLGCDDSLLGVETKKFDVSLMFGGGVSIGVGAGALLFDLVYDLSLTQVNDVTGNLGDFKNRALLLSAGLAFPIY